MTMNIKVTKKQLIEMLTNAINDEDGIEVLRSFTMNYYSGDYCYDLESPDMENFFHIVEDYNTYDESFGDVNQKFTLIRLRDALIKNTDWSEELLIAMIRFDRIALLDAQYRENKLSKEEFFQSLRKYCYDNTNLEKVLFFFNKERARKS